MRLIDGKLISQEWALLCVSVLSLNIHNMYHGNTCNVANVIAWLCRIAGAKRVYLTLIICHFCADFLLRYGIYFDRITRHCCLHFNGSIISPLDHPIILLLCDMIFVVHFVKSSRHFGEFEV
jgi:hypothetical protein